MSLKRSTAEFTGTFLLVFCGTGAIVINETSGGAISHPGIAAVFGLAVFTLIMTFGKISGAHMNPAVTITQWIRKKLAGSHVIAYLLAQLAGGFAASFLLHVLFPLNEKLGSTLPAGSELQSFILEVLLTFFLMLAIIRSSEGGYSLATVAAVVGGVVGLEALFAGPICGASMNPVRSIAPAIVSGHTEHLWIYIAAPLLGAVAAGFFDLIFEKEKN